MNYQLLVLDIDGTVTNSKKEVLKKTREAVIRIQEQGIRVVLASGRPPEGVFPIARELQLDRFGSYVLAFNGARIIDFRTRNCMFEKCLPRHIPARLLEEAGKNGIGMAAYQEGFILSGTGTNKYLELESFISGMRIEHETDPSVFSRLSVNECLLTGDPQDMENLEPVFKRRYFHEVEIFNSEPFYLEVTPKNVDKAYGLKHLLRILEIPREAMVCCGDSYNDMGMLQTAGVGVAMANAPDRVKAVADYVTVNDNDHDGIAEVIERFF